MNAQLAVSTEAVAAFAPICAAVAISVPTALAVSGIRRRSRRGERLNDQSAVSNSIEGAPRDGHAKSGESRLASRRMGSVVVSAVRSILASLQRLAPGLVARAGRQGSRSLIARAGLTGAIGARDVAAARLLCAASALAITPRLLEMLPTRMWPIALPLWIAAGAELPLWWLRRTGIRRSAAVREALPDALELMRACLAAGLPLRRALLLVGDHCAEPLAGELICVAGESSLGIPLTVALDGLVARNQLPEIRALVSAIRQAERHGSPLAPVIAAQAVDTRTAHNRAVVERGARAAPKIQLIVATTIVPAAMLGLAAVVIAAIARGELEFI